MLAHNVYFTLEDDSPEARSRLAGACKKYLSGHPGTVFFACGTLAEELLRPVNVRDFHVALHVIFEDRESHDRYQVDERHVRFIEEQQENWKSVRVFDSIVES